MQFLKRIPVRFIDTLVYSKANQSGADLPENGKPVPGIAAEAFLAVPSQFMR